MTISRRFRQALWSRRADGERMYQIARRADVHPVALSAIVNGSLPIRADDPRVGRVALVLGLSPDECFESDEVGTADAVRAGSVPVVQ
jgi:hypothetical protein